VIEDDASLKQYEHDINLRQLKYKSWMERFAGESGSFLDFTRSYNLFGLNLNKNGNLEYREWAPSARELSLFGDFNGWNRDSHKCAKDDFGVWTLVLPKNEDGSLPIPHDTKFKCCITT